MTVRTVTDSAGRTWTCTGPVVADDDVRQEGRDVVLSCETASVAGPVKITMGWQWRTMADNGLARLISKSSPPQRR